MTQDRFAGDNAPAQAEQSHQSPGRDRPPRSRARSVTRDLMIAAAFGALGALILLTVAPLTTSLAATFPPAYALAAGIHSVLPYLARRILAVPFAATLVGALVGVLSFASTPLGPLILVSLLAATLPFDLVLNVCRRFAPALRTRHYLTAALAAAVVLFLVSLPVFSAERLTGWMPAAVLAGRLIGQCGAVWVSGLVAAGIHRAGIRSRRPE